MLRRNTNCFVYKFKFLKVFKRTVTVLYNGNRLNNIQQRENLRKYLCCIVSELNKYLNCNEVLSPKALFQR